MALSDLLMPTTFLVPLQRCRIVFLGPCGSQLAPSAERLFALPGFSLWSLDITN